MSSRFNQAAHNPRMTRTPSNSTRVTAVLLVVVAGLGGCNKIFGEYRVTDDEPTVEVPDTLCVAGSFRCVGPFLYACGADLNSWVAEPPCSTPAHCSSRQGRCLPCIEGEHRCNQQLLEECRNDSEWHRVDECPSFDACNLNSDSCRPCTPGEYQCNQGTLMQCTEQQTWNVLMTCPNAATCHVNPERTMGECSAQVCTDFGKHRCNNAQLLRCSLTGDRLVEIANCDYPELCNAQAADQQVNDGLLATCLEAVCTPQKTRCVGADLQVCADAVTGWTPVTTCPSPEACSAELGACQPCTPGAVECNDKELRRCTPSSTWETLAECESNALCDAETGTCRSRGCEVPNQGACLPDGLYRCPPDQTKYKLITVCAGDLCNDNDQQCDAARCAEGQKRCADNTFQECDKSLLAWDVKEECAANETCDLSGCQPAGCEENAYRCNDIYLERCEGGTWIRKDRCATSALCLDEQQRCDRPACEIGQFNCLGQSLQRCRADRTKFEDIRDCSSEGLICDDTTGTCRPAAP